jgi:hypothetical protein
MGSIAGLVRIDSKLGIWVAAIKLKARSHEGPITGCVTLTNFAIVAEPHDSPDVFARSA